MRSRGEAHEEKPRARIPKTGYWPAPVRFAAVGAPLNAADFLAVRDKAGTAETFDNLLIEHLELCQKPVPAQRL